MRTNKIPCCLFEGLRSCGAYLCIYDKPVHIPVKENPSLDTPNIPSTVPKTYYSGSKKNQVEAGWVWNPAMKGQEEKGVSALANQTKKRERMQL